MHNENHYAWNKIKPNIPVEEVLVFQAEAYAIPATQDIIVAKLDDLMLL